MSRDLLYKPPVPFVVPEDEDNSKVKPGGKGAQIGTKAPPRSRDLGRTDTPSARTPTQGRPPTPMAGEASGSQPAFKAAYFNQDTSGVREVNLRQRNMQALRGSEGASDLRQIVLPPSVAGIETPDPMQLRGASDLMGLDGSIELTLEGFLGRQSAWTKGKGVTVEMLKARLAQLEEMVEARRRALARLFARKGNAAPSVTLEMAMVADGKALDHDEDIVAAGADLVQRTAGQAEGMHRRIAKTLGIKPKG